jgi:hypothetical protein
MKILKVEEFTDEWGLHERRCMSNGCNVTILKKPSKAYIDKQKKRKEESMKRMEEKNKKKEREKLIRDRMRENAIKELKAEGLLED